MSDITTNLKKLYDISRCRSMRQFAKLVDIDQSNLQKKMASNNYTKTDVQKICFHLGVRKEWLENSDGEMFDEKSAVCPNDWVFGNREPNINMVNEENAHHNKQIVGDFSESEINLLREQVADLRKQVADLRKQVESKDAQIKQLMDLLAKK